MTSLQEYLAEIGHLKDKLTQTQNKLDFAIATVVQATKYCGENCHCHLHSALEQLKKR